MKKQSMMDTAALQAALDAIHRAGIPGVFAEVRSPDQVWSGASGVADTTTESPVTADMRQRVGSLTKTFTTAAVLLQVEQGRVSLDAPISGLLPQFISKERGDLITVRMLLNHTSGLPEYLPYAFPSLGSFPSLLDVSPESFDDNQFRQFSPSELIEMGVSAPAAGTPGGTPGVYSNTNYLLLGQLLEKLTGITAEECITRDVIERAGLRNTYFPGDAHIQGPHSKMYEALFGHVDPPRDYSVYNMSWVTTGAGMVSTVDDLNLFYAELLAGKIVNPSSLSEMQQTVPVISQTGKIIEYGLGLHRTEVPGCGICWGHTGTAWGAETVSLTRADGNRQMSIAMNLAHWNLLDASGVPQPHAIDEALAQFKLQALSG